MNHSQVLREIAEFSEYGECVVIKQSDWDTLVNWVKSLPSEENRPNFDILPVMFSMHEEVE